MILDEDKIACIAGVEESRHMVKEGRKRVFSEVWPSDMTIQEILDSNDFRDPEEDESNSEEEEEDDDHDE